MRICILGAGALGSAIGGTLAAAGSDVVLVTRDQDHVDAVNGRGLHLRTAAGEQTVRVRAAVDTAGMATFDLVIVLVKSPHTREAIERARGVVGPQTVVMSLQNGLGHEALLADVVGSERVVAGKTYVGGVLVEPGRAVVGVAGKETVIGELDGSASDRVHAIARELTSAGLRTAVSSNIRGVMWDKLLINVATGALSGITRLTYGNLYQVPEVERCAIAAVAEAMAVAKAKGIELATGEPRDAWVKAAAGLPAGFKTSMLQSLEKGSRTEIDFINGAVIRAGAESGIPTPVNETLVAAIKGIERSLPSAAGRTA